MNFINSNYMYSIIVVIIIYVFYFIIKRALNKIIEKSNNLESSNKKKTYVRLFKNLLKYIFLIASVICVLQINGVNVTSFLAGLGVVSVIAGLALQDALKDIIMGLNIIIDDYFSVGDVLKINSIEGKVVEVGLKVTKLKDINTENVYIISNRSITEALRISEQLDIDIPLPHEEKVEKMERIIDIIISNIRELDGIKDIEYKGIKEFGESAIYYKIRMHCKPEDKPVLKRAVNRIIKLELDNNNILIPYNQIDIHTK